MSIKWYKTELAIRLDTKNESIRCLVQNNPIESLFDTDDSDYSNIKLSRMRMKTKTGTFGIEIYAEMSSALAKAVR